MARPSSAEIVRMRTDLAKVRRAIDANLAVIQERAERGKRLIEEREAIRFALRDAEGGDGGAGIPGGGADVQLREDRAPHEGVR